MPMYLGSDDQGSSSYSLQDFEPSFGSKMNAAVRESWLESYGPVAMDYAISKFGGNSDTRLSAQQAMDYAKNNGGGIKLNLTPKDGQYTGAQWATIVARQRELAAVKDVRERTPWDAGSILRGGAMFGAGIVDPLNLASAFVPWTRMVGAARGLQAATVGGTALSRAGARAGIGAIDGGISTAVLEPAYSFGRNELGDDYGALDSIANIAFGTAFGGGLHVLGGAAGDAYKSWRGRASPMVTPNPTMETAAPLSGSVAGLDTKVKVGDTYEPARWSVVEADTLQATVDKADNQFRDRSRPAYQAEIQSRANSLDPELVLGDSPVMDIGAPTLAADGRIVGGNGRTLFISKAYEIGKGGDYRAALEARLADLGIDVDAVRSMKKPVLVRQFTRNVDVKRAAMLSNEGGATDMSPLEQAKVDAERLGDARLSVGTDGDINNAENRAAIRKWVEAQPENKRNSIMDSDGKLSPEGLRRLNGAMLFKAYGDSPVLARLIEAVDPGSRNLALALGRTAPVVAGVRQSINAGDLHPLDIAADLQQAVEKYNQIRADGLKVSDYMAQLDAFGDGLTPEATMLLDFMGRNIQSPRRIMDAITGFADRLNEAGNPKQSDMFGAAPVHDKARMLQDAIAAAEERVDSAAEVAASVSPETREAALRAAVAQSLDGRNVDVEAIIGMDPDRATHTVADAEAAADRNFSPDQVATADVEAAAAVQQRVDTAPKWDGVKDAQDAMAEADALLADTVKAGDDAFKYSRGEAKGQKKATIWHGTTARFAPEDGAPLGRFRWDMINSEAGEGFQARGYGHYVAQQAWISQTRYRERLIKMKGKSALDFYMPDGAGGVMKIGKDNDPAWQLADGTIIHERQKDPKLSALAGAIAQIDGYGYARARQTFESILNQRRKYVEESLQKKDERIADLRSDLATASENEQPQIQNMIDHALKTKDDIRASLDKDEALLAALDEVTVPDPAGPDGEKVLGKMLENLKEQGDSSSSTYKDVLAGYEIAKTNRILAPGIKKYEPPVPENFRTRVVQDDGTEVTGDLAEFIRQEAKRQRSVSQTLGVDLKQGESYIDGANVKVAPLDLITGTKFDEQLQALHDSGITELTVERPGSLYRAEMSAEDFSNLMLYDEPMSAQPEKVLKAFKEWGILREDYEDIPAEVFYADLADHIRLGHHDDFLDDIMVAVHEAATRRGMDPFDAGVDDFGADELASIMLHNAGVPGHAFLDGVSRGAADLPAYNLVLYSDDVAKIMDRYARQTGEVLRATDDPDGLTEALRLSFGKSTDALIKTGGVKIVATPDDLPFGPHPGDVKGFAAPDGVAYIVASNVSELEARGMLLHEVGVHVGMEKMLGPDVFQSVLKELDDAILRGEDWAQAARGRVPEKTAPHLVREEQLAYLVQHAPDLISNAADKSTVKRLKALYNTVIAAVRAWAYRTFDLAREKMTLGEGDFRAMAVAALHDAARGERRGVLDGVYAKAGATFAEVRAGDTVDGRVVRSEVPNMGSIAASLDNYTVVPGIRAVPMSAFDAGYLRGVSYKTLDQRTKKLADEITSSKEINPLIVAFDADGAYIIEGGHRFDALIASGAKEIPAVVVIDDSNPPANASLSGVYAKAQTASKAFRDWFGESKVVGADGEPLVVYHGGYFDPSSDAVPRITKDGFHFGTSNASQVRLRSKIVDDFINDMDMDLDADGRWHWSSSGMDSYDVTPAGFSTEKKAFDNATKSADQYADSILDGGETGMQTTASYLAIKNPKRVKDQKNDWADAIQQAKKEGYDGIVYKNEFEDKGKDSYIAFRPEQIKSATGNRGTFDPANPDIRYSRGVVDGVYARGGSHLALLRDWIDVTRRPGALRGPLSDRDAFERIRSLVRKNAFDYELRSVPVNEMHPSQFGEEYLNDSSRIAAEIKRSAGSSDDISYLGDILPVLLHFNGEIMDGNHRHAAAVLNGEAEIPALVPIGRGSGRVVNLDAIDGGLMKYSRGETQDTSTAKDELKPYDDAVKRAKGYASVLRAAADKLDNDAQAAAAMRAAMPDITPQEITDLLDQLRRSVKGLRGMARTARDAVTADDRATGMQYEAMQAADTLANNLEMAAVIEKRNAALNMNARLKASSYLNQFRGAGLDFEGFRGLLVGTERKRVGGRVSVEAEQKNFRGEWLGGLIADLEKADLMRHFTSGEFDRDTYVALYNLAKDGAGNEKLPKEAVAIAEIVNKYQSDARNKRNRFGAWIRDLQGYIVRQSHDMFKIREAGEKSYKEAVLPLLDVKRSLRDFDGSVDDFLTRVYDDFASGSHMKTPAGEDDLQAFGRGASLARRESQSRVLYFKDGDAAYQYNQKFGQGRLAESVLGGLDHAAKSAGLLKMLGTNPSATLERLFAEYAESLRGDPSRRAKFLAHRKELDNLLAQVDGTVNIPGNATAAQISSFFRAWQTMAKLGGMVISSVTDLTNYASELRFGQDKNLLSGTLDGIGSLAQGRASGEKRAILNSLGVFHESTLGSVFHRFDSPDLIGGKTSAVMQQFFKLSGINWWTESLRDGYALSHSAYVASHADRSFDKLPAALRDMLGLYNIDAGKWDVLRLANTTMSDGKKYITPDGLRTVPRAALENYITQVGRTVSDAAVMNLQDDLSSALRTMTIDRMHHAVIEPGARTRAFMLRGTQPGTVPGELLRFVSQFKSFPVALIQMTLGREVYGRGYDTLGDYLKRGKGDMLGLASFIALSTAMGYAAMSIKDMLKGKNPRPVDDPRTWAAAMVQGGGLGIYGDFLFGKYNRTGGSLSGSMAGPVVNLADTAADLWTRIRTGDDVAATAFNAALANTPFANLFYTRVMLDYLILYRIQESLNPGFLRRMESRTKRENDQTYFLPPSQVAR